MTEPRLTHRVVRRHDTGHATMPLFENIRDSVAFRLCRE